MSGRPVTAAVPSIAERRKPGLSETLRFPRQPDTCQSCGLTADPSDGIALRLWVECDEWDRATTPPVFVVLCRNCSHRLIDAHPRLYHARDINAPNIGTMGLCVACPKRDGLTCTSPLARANGGPGMEVRYANPPIYAHVRATGSSGFRWIYQGEPTFCAGREVTPE